MRALAKMYEVGKILLLISLFGFLPSETAGGAEDTQVVHSMDMQMRVQTQGAGQAGMPEKQLSAKSADEVELHRCKVVPDPQLARLQINQILLQATGKAMTRPSAYTSSQQTVSTFSPDGFVPDGNLEKKAWKNAKRIRFDHDWSGKRNHPEAMTEVASIWTPTHAYFAFWCKYTTLNIYEGEDPAPERWELWNRDVVEVFANPNPERILHYYEFEVSPNNQWIDLEINKEKEPFNDAGWNSHFEHATRIDAKNKIWTCEMRIPAASMNVSVIKAGMDWRINFYRADGPGPDSQRRFMAWSPTGGQEASFHVPERFGIIRFEE